MVNCPVCTFAGNSESSSTCTICDHSLLSDAAKQTTRHVVTIEDDDEDEEDDSGKTTDLNNARPLKRYKKDAAVTSSTISLLGATGDTCLPIQCPSCTYINQNVPLSSLSSTSTTVSVCEVCETPLILASELDPSSYSSSSPSSSSSSTCSLTTSVWTASRIIQEQKEEMEDGTCGVMENLHRISFPSTHIIRLCSAPVIHYSQRSSDILHQWSCGWRNVQVLSSSLLQRPEFKQLLFGGCGYVPKTLYLQHWLERAWADGFDEEGAAHYNRRIVGKSDWIGACEVATAARQFRIRAYLVQASRPDLKEEGPGKGGAASAAAGGGAATGGNVRDKASEAMKKEGVGGASSSSSSSLGAAGGEGGGQQTRLTPGEAIVEFCRRYFESDWETFDLGAAVREVQQAVVGGKLSSSASSSDAAKDFFKPRGAFRDQATPYRPPLLFQHQGHSRTIVGIETILPTELSGGGGRKRTSAGKTAHGSSKSFNLIIFDPAADGSKLFESTKNQKGWQRFLKRGPHTLFHPDYQVLVVLPGLMSDKEWEASKLLDTYHLIV